MTETVTATYKSGLSGAGISIEQEPWPKSRGVITARQAMEMMTKFMASGVVPDGRLNCTDLPAVINVYPEPAGLDYSLHTSWGNLSGPTISDVEEVVAVTVNFANPTLAGPVLAIGGIDWLVGPFDERGNSIARPQCARDGNQLVFDSQPFFAGLMVRYLRRRHQYKLTLPARHDAAENPKQATVYGIHGEDITHLEIKPPPEDGICLDAEKYASDTTIGPPPGGGDGAPINKRTLYDYCDGTITRTTIA